MRDPKSKEELLEALARRDGLRPGVASEVGAELGVPVYSIHTMVSWFQAGLMPPRFSAAMHDPRW